MSEPEVRRGRPAGSVKSPEVRMLEELVAQLKLYRDSREAIEMRLAEGTPSLQDLVAIQDASRRGVIEMAKALTELAKSKSPEEAEAFDAEKFMETLGKS